MTKLTPTSAVSWNVTNMPVFLPTHTSPELATGYACFPVVFYRNATVTSVAHTSVQRASVSERIERLQANPARAAALAKARSRLGQWMQAENLPQTGLAALRLKAGLSQKALAEKLGTQQSNVSRWEKSPGDMQYSTLKSWAAALNLSLEDVCKAIDSNTPEGA